MLAVIAVAQIIISWVALVLGIVLGIWLFLEARRTRSHKLTLRAYIVFIGGFLLCMGLFWPAVAYLYTEHLWYANIGFASVFWRILGTKWKIFLQSAGVAAGFLLINLLIADRLCPVSRDFQRWTRQRTQNVRRAAIILIILASCILAAPMMRLWNEYLIYQNQTTFGHNRLSQVVPETNEVSPALIEKDGISMKAPLRAVIADGEGFYIAGDDSIYHAAYSDNEGWMTRNITKEIKRPRAMILVDGWLYVSSGGAIYRIHPQRNSIEIWARGLSSPRGMTVDR